jgi:TolB protein
MLALAAVACTSTADDPDLPDVDVGSSSPSSSPTGSSPTASPTSSSEGRVPASLGGRLIVIDDAGNLVNVAPDGSDAIVLAEVVEGESVVLQPTWSPDGSRVAWVRLEATAGEPAATLVTTTARGTERTEAPTTVAPFYLSWDPTSSRIAFLGSPGDDDIQLGVVDVSAGGTEATSLDRGDPFYLSWDPTGHELLVHVGFDRLDRLSLDGSLDTVNSRPGSFRAPVWTADGASFVYAAGTPAGQHLVVQDVARARADDLVSFSGSIAFVVSPDGSRIAFQVVEGANDVQPLSVIDRETGDVEQVTSSFVPAFFWSPRGDRLLHMLPEEDAGQVWFRWAVWGGNETITSDRFYPSQTFGRDYLPFFEQYAQSMSLWAPDGSAFAYAGINEAGEAGVWVQTVRPPGAPVRVMDGSFATWSPR